MIYVIHGEEEFLRSRYLAEIKQRAGPPDLVALNTTELDGNHLSFSELQHATEAIPFLNERRLVIVRGLLKRLSGRHRKSDDGRSSELTQLLDHLAHIPETTDLIFLEDQALNANHPVLRHIQPLTEQAKARVYHCQAPTQYRLPDWIRQHAQAKGAKISRQAAEALATAIGPNLRLIDTELEKLIAYVGPDRPIEASDVEAIVPYAKVGSVFQLTDAIAERRASRAFSLLHQLRASGESTFSLLSLIERHFRILLQVHELAHAGYKPQQIASQLRQHGFVVERALRQLRRWTPDQLRAAFQHLLATDVAIKTGQIDEDSALDLLLITLLQGERPIAGKHPHSPKATPRFTPHP